MNVISNHTQLYEEKSVNIYIANYIGNNDMKLKNTLSIFSATLSTLIVLSFPAKATELLKAEPISKAQLHIQANVNLAQTMNLSPIELTSIGKDAKALLRDKTIKTQQKQNTFLANNHLLAD